MGKTEKKFGKGRLDHYYRLAKEKGYRARSSFKIIQLNQKYGFFNQPKGQKPKPMCVIDLCAAPGSWCQVATQQCPVNSLIVGVDLAPIKPLPHVITFQSDITTDHCRSQLRGYLKTWKADVVMHDGAPNVGMSWTQDAFTQSELVLQSLKLAIEFLAPGGWFVTKVFRSKDYNKLMWVFQQFFEKCEATKPPSSRGVSAEIFVVCKGFKAPREIDHRLLNAKYVFEELKEKETAGNMQAKVFNPEKKTRSRQGYGDDAKDLIIKATPIMDFIDAEDPVATLGNSTELVWDKSVPGVRDLYKLPLTTPDLLECFKDLRVLGKKDFRTMLRWRVQARKLLGIDKPEEEKEEVKPELSTQEQIDKELEDYKQRELSRRRRERKHKNVERQKSVVRMQLGIETPMEIGIEHEGDRGGLFDLNRIRKSGYDPRKDKKIPSSVPRAERDNDFDLGDADLNDPAMAPSDESEEEKDVIEVDEDDIDQLEEQLDNMYERYRSEQALSAEVQAKKEREREPWYGINSASEASDVDSDEDQDGARLSSNASMFFDDDTFNDMAVASGSSEGDTDSEVEDVKMPKLENKNSQPETMEADSMSDEEERYDPTKADEDENDKNIKMTLAHKLATGEITKHDLINEGYNKYSFRDTDGLPNWFLDDEKKHSKILKPITKEAAAAIKEQEKTLNARPIKKVREAQARKQMRAARRLERIRKKSETISEDGSKSEMEKSEAIARLFRNAKKDKVRKPVTVIKAAGVNKRLQGRPRGVKGKYKMVDGTMKKEQRALKRIAKKRK